MLREKEIEGKKINEGKRDGQITNQAAAPASSPPSASSSPSHEFSFTISLHPPPPPPPNGTKIPEKNTKSPPSFAIDLSPADEIFFHGHLLPLHLLSHLPISPRSSTNSMDSFTLPIKDLLQENPTPRSNFGADHNNNNNDNNRRSIHNGDQEHVKRTTKSQVLEQAKLSIRSEPKSKSFSLFGWRRDENKSSYRKESDDRRRQPNKKRLIRFDLSRVVKKYLRLVIPFLSLRNRRNSRHFHRQAYSFSGNMRVRSKKELTRGRRGEYSAPASMSTSPANSGLLVPSGSVTPTAKSDSTMEELQAAIQAAIAHCKKSISDEDKIKNISHN